MARYFFNIVVRGRKAIPDPEGDELAGDKEAREHAKMIAREMLSADIGINAALSIRRLKSRMGTDGRLA